MKVSLSRWVVAACLAAMVTSNALAQPAQQPAEPAKEFTPQVGQEGKDVVWVPTPQALVDRMLDIAKATTSDYVIDLGSGDGRTVITAAKRGINALGIEYNPDMVALSQRNAEKEGVGDKAKFVRADLFQTDFSKATVVTMFLLPEINQRLRPKILDMAPGTRIVSNTFDMGDWQPDATISAENDNCRSYCRAYFWIVPAKVAGTWTIPQGTLTLEQKYQEVTGALRTGGKSVRISEGKLRGTEITFVAGDMRYTGTVNGKTIDGTMAPTFKATRR